jgi:hypothetical protein
MSVNKAILMGNRGKVPEVRDRGQRSGSSLELYYFRVVL